MADLSVFDMRPTILEVAFEVTRHRPAPSGYDADGFPGAPTFTDATILAHVEPAPNAALQRLPEGQRSDDALLMIVPQAEDDATTPTVQGGSVVGSVLPDEFTIRGERWQAADVTHHTPSGLYYEVVVQRVGRG